MASRKPLNYPRFQLLDSNGKPIPNGTVEFFDAGTTNNRDIYSDAGLTTTLPNPVTLNSRGEPETGGGTATDIYLDNQPYKIVAKDASSNTVWTIDNYIAEDANNTQIVSTLTDLQALSAGGFKSVYMNGRSSEGDGGEGRFRWDSSNLSTEVGNDEVTTNEGDGGIYVAPSSDKTGASGAWVRQYITGSINLAWYGATDGTDITSLLRTAIGSPSQTVSQPFNADSRTSALEIIVPDGAYGISGEVELRSGLTIRGPSLGQNVGVEQPSPLLFLTVSGTAMFRIPEGVGYVNFKHIGFGSDEYTDTYAILVKAKNAYADDEFPTASYRHSLDTCYFYGFNKQLALLRPDRSDGTKSESDHQSDGWDIRHCVFYVPRSSGIYCESSNGLDWSVIDNCYFAAKADTVTDIAHGCDLPRTGFIEFNSCASGTKTPSATTSSDSAYMSSMFNVGHLARQLKFKNCQAEADGQFIVFGGSGSHSFPREVNNCKVDLPIWAQQPVTVNFSNNEYGTSGKVKLEANDCDLRGIPTAQVEFGSVDLINSNSRVETSGLSGSISEVSLYERASSTEYVDTFPKVVVNEASINGTKTLIQSQIHRRGVYKLSLMYNQALAVGSFSITLSYQDVYFNAVSNTLTSDTNLREHENIIETFLATAGDPSDSTKDIKVDLACDTADAIEVYALLEYQKRLA